MKIIAVVQTGYLFVVFASCTAALWMLVFLNTSVMLVNTELHGLSSLSSALQPWVGLGLLFMIFTLTKTFG